MHEHNTIQFQDGAVATLLGQLRFICAALRTAAVRTTVAPKPQPSTQGIGATQIKIVVILPRQHAARDDRYVVPTLNMMKRTHSATLTWIVIRKTYRTAAITKAVAVLFTSTKSKNQIATPTLIVETRRSRRIAAQTLGAVRRMTTFLTTSALDMVFLSE